MPVKLHRCPNEWVKLKGHPCWRVEKALQDMGIDYELDRGPLRRSKRDELMENLKSAFDDARRFLARTLRAGDLCLMMGAGNIDALARSLVEPRP